MRHQNKWRMKHILPMMALVGLGLMSCEEEVIPFEEDDLVVAEGQNKGSDDDESFDYIVDADGNVIGSFDRELNLLDANGNLVSIAKDGLAGRDNFAAPQRVVTYANKNFTGRRDAWYGNGSGFIDLTGHPSFETASSLIIAPNIVLDLYETSGRHRQFDTRNGKPIYIPDLSTYLWEDDIAYMSITSYSEENTFCGFVWKDVNYAGHNIPIYAGADPLKLTNFSGWNDQISSVSHNAYGDCDGLGFWQHATVQGSNREQRRLFRTGDDSDLHNDNMGDQISLIESDRHAGPSDGYGDANPGNLARLLDEVSEVEQKKNWGCNFASEVCSHKGINLGTGGGLGTLALCTWYFGSAGVTAVLAALVTIGTDGIGVGVSAFLAAIAEAQGAKALLCLASAGIGYAAGAATCTTALENWCVVNTKN